MTLSLDLLLGFALFALVTSITPGPNNTMLLASGVNFGFNRTIPHMLGITCGFFVLVVAVGFGLGAVFQTYPLLYAVLRYVGAAYLLYLAWKIAHSGPVSDGEQVEGKPISYLGAAAFQWVNPKAWIMAIGAISTYTPMQGYFTNVIVIAAVRPDQPAERRRLGCVRHAVAQRAEGPSLVAPVQLGHGALLVASLYPLLLESFR
jgi:threonine/homoserine/homoserine lactone efflux protein